MRLKNLDLNLLIALDALLIEQSITRASQRLHISQPGMSAALARLREFFGDELLVQTGRRMVLTPRGESLIKPVHDILLQIQALIDSPAGFDPATSRRKFVFVMSDYTASVLTPRLLQEAQSVAPHLMFEFIALTDNPEEVLDRGDVDFLLMPERFLSDTHPRCAVFEDDYVCVGWSDNPIMQRDLKIEQYMEAGHVVVRFGTQRMPSIDEWLTSHRGLERRIEVIASSFSAVPQYIVGTTRIATMHRRLANLWSSQVRLKVVPAPMDIPSLRWGLQWHSCRNYDLGTLWMRDFVLSTAQLLDR